MEYNIDTTEQQAFYRLFLNQLSLSHITTDEHTTLCGKEINMWATNQDMPRIHSTDSIGCSVCRKAMLKRQKVQKLDNDISAKVL